MFSLKNGLLTLLRNNLWNTKLEQFQKCFSCPWEALIPVFISRLKPEPVQRFTRHETLQHVHELLVSAAFLTWVLCLWTSGKFVHSPTHIGSWILANAQCVFSLFVVCTVGFPWKQNSIDVNQRKTDFNWLDFFYSAVCVWNCTLSKLWKYRHMQ